MTSPPPQPKPRLSLTREQLLIVFTIASVQFVNILDFVIIMPLGPDFAPELGISEADLGYVNAAYTASAAVTGLLGSFFLDRFDRRKALAVAVAGLVFGTALCGMAQSAAMLFGARLLAGAFGGPATSLSLAIISDAIPAALRGRAMGIVMGAFSVASVLGVPAGLWLGEAYGWRTPLFTVAGLGLLIGIVAITALPPLRAHLDRPPVKRVRTLELLGQPLVRWSYLMTSLTMMAGFVIIPNLAAYLQLNMGMPREDLKYGYLFGGVASFFATQLGGRLVDRFSGFKVGVVGSLGFIAVVAVMFAPAWREVATVMLVLGFIGFMSGTGLRNVAYHTLATRVPRPEVRARFQSLQSAVQHASSAFAAFLSAQLLVTLPDAGGVPRLVGMPMVCGVAIGLAAIVPLLMWVVERGVRRQEAEGVEVALAVPAR